MKENKCPNCGGNYKSGARFCPHCGHELLIRQQQNRIGLTELRHRDWKWYSGIILLVVVAVTSLAYVVIANENYQAVLSQHEPSIIDAYDKVGSKITSQIVGVITPAYICFALALAGLIVLLIRGSRKQLTIIVVVVELILGVAAVANFSTSHNFSLSSSQLGKGYVEKCISGKIYEYSYYRDKADSDDKDSDDDESNQIPDKQKGYPNDYSHVFLKFNSDGTLGVNVNPYWRDADDIAYENSKVGNYRTEGTWHVNKAGQLHISWDQTDTRAYEYQAVKVRKKHHKRHHSKYKTEYKWIAQYTDPETGDDDLSLPIYFPGDDIDGNVSFGVRRFNVDGVKFQRPDSSGGIESEN